MVTPPSMPLVGDLTLTAVQQIDHVLDAGFAAVEVPGLDGHPVQRAGRGSHAIRIQGVLRGESAADDLAALQELAAAGTEVPFSADITTALELQNVVVTDFRAEETAGVERLTGYELWLVENPPLPPPAEVSGFGFGGLDDFGLGGLGFDTDIMGDLAGLADQVAGAIDAVMDAADQLAALASLVDLDVGGPLRPLSDGVAGVVAAGQTFASVSTALSGLLGGGE
jgi:hypothetical protein